MPSYLPKHVNTNEKKAWWAKLRQGGKAQVGIYDMGNRTKSENLIKKKVFKKLHGACG